jgi:hypothetical protein
MKAFHADRILMYVFIIQETRSHKWHVHDQDIINDQMSPMDKRCKSAKGHYNPYQVSLEVSVQDVSCF